MHNMVEQCTVYVNPHPTQPLGQSRENIGNQICFSVSFWVIILITNETIMSNEGRHDCEKKDKSGKGVCDC